MKIFRKELVGYLAVAVISCGVSFATYAFLNNHSSFSSKESVKEDSGFAKPVSFSNVPSHAINTDFTVAAENAVNGVVHIKSTQQARAIERGGQNMDPFYEFFFGNRGGGNMQPQPRVGMGSGVIISSDGYIVTNNHVVEESDEVLVTLNDNRSFNAKVVGTDPNTDLALLKVEAKDLPTLKFGNSDDLKVGEWVLAVGNPFQLNSTVTAGIVSAKARSIGILSGAKPMGIESFIQTDAAVNPGNSGGALVNTNGELIGINTAIYSQTGQYAGYSFAIPSSIVSKVITDLKQYGSVQRAMLGIGMKDLVPELIKEKDLSIQEGAYVAGVSERSAALEAGLKEGDVITGVNDVKIKNGAALQEQISRYRPGDKVKITFRRGKEDKSVSVTLKNSQGNTSITKVSGMESLGAAFKPLTDKDKKSLSLRTGVQVTGITNGKFKEAGIRDGFIILSINNAPISSANDVEKIYTSIVKGDTRDKAMFIAGVYPNGKTGYYAVDLSE